MGQMIVRAIPDEALEDFKARAKSEGIPAETLARQIIVRESKLRPMSFADAVAGLDRLRAMTPKPLPSSVPLLRALRDGEDADR